MAKNTFTSTASYVQVATGPCVITVLKAGRGTLFLNETATDTDAYRYSKETLGVNDQLEQFSSVDTYIKGSDANDPWVLLVDGAAL